MAGVAVERDSGTGSDGKGSGTTTLKSGALGTFSVAFLIVSAAAPLGYLAGYGPLALLIGGPGAAASFVLGGLALAAFLGAFTTMTPYVKSSGAFYAYVRAGLGRAVGTVAAVFAVVAYNLALVGALGAIATYLVPHVDDLVGGAVPWPVVAVAATLTVFAIAAAGIDLGARFLGVLLIAETAIILVVVVAVLLDGGAHGLSLDAFGLDRATAPGMGAALALTFVGFLGIEGIALYRSEARDPDRTIRRAGALAVGSMAVFYILVTWAVVQAFGTDEVQGAAEQHGADLFFVAADQYVGGWAATTMQWLIITSLLAAQLAFHNAGNRYLHALSRDGVLPRRLAVVGRRTGAPWVAGAFATVVSLVGVAVAALLGWDPYFEMSVWLLSLAVVLILLLQVLTCVAVVVFLGRRADVPGRVRGIVCAVVAIGLLAVAGYELLTQFELLSASGPEQNATILTVLAGFVVVTVVGVAAVARFRPDALRRVGQDPDDTAAPDAA